MTIERVCKIIGFGLNLFISERKTIKRNGKRMFVEVLIPNPHPMQIIKIIQFKTGGDNYAGRPLPPSHWVGLMLKDFNESNIRDSVGKTYNTKVTPEEFINILEERKLVMFEDKEIIPVEAMDIGEKEEIILPSLEEVKNKLFSEKNKGVVSHTKTIKSDTKKDTIVKPEKVSVVDKKNDWGFDD